MNIKRAKLCVLAAVAALLLAIGIFNINSVRAVSDPVRATTDDVAETYKSKCAMCHKPTAEKFFDASKMDEVLVETVLKGKKAEKPPNMPGFEEKGMTADQAKLLVAYMRQMKTPPKP